MCVCEVCFMGEGIIINTTYEKNRHGEKVKRNSPIEFKFVFLRSLLHAPGTNRFDGTSKKYFFSFNKFRYQRKRMKKKSKHRIHIVCLLVVYAQKLGSVHGCTVNTNSL